MQNIQKTEYNHPWIAQRADPYVLRHIDGFYYFTASVPEFDRIVLRRARSLDALALAEEHVVWTRHENGPMSCHIWAPELHWLDGRWYIYFAAGAQDHPWRIRPYVLECADADPILGNWVEKGKMECAGDDDFSFESFSLDATVFEHREVRYLVWAEKVGVGKAISNLYIAVMENPCKLKTAQVLLTTPDYDWERIGYWVNEGPAVLKKNGKIYISFSCSATDENYCVGLLTADENTDLLDPQSWKKSHFPVLRTDEEKGVYGPGHNCFTQSEDGRDVMIFHARPYPGTIGTPLNDPNRHALRMEVRWDSNGDPVFEYQKQNT